MVAPSTRYVLPKCRLVILVSITAHGEGALFEPDPVFNQHLVSTCQLGRQSDPVKRRRSGRFGVSGVPWR